MFELKRILNINGKIYDSHTDYNISIYDKKFLLDDSDFFKLMSLEHEYEYEKINDFDLLIVDRNPSRVQEVISNEEFIQDYVDHLDERFFVMYIYRWKHE